MKKVIIILFFIIFIIGSCSSKQKIVGTWIDEDGDTWAFKSNGKLILPESLNMGDDGPFETNYNILTFGKSSTKLEYTGWGMIDNWIGPVTWKTSLLTFDISISDDGRKMILSNGTSKDIDWSFGFGDETWLTKK